MLLVGGLPLRVGTDEARATHTHSNVRVTTKALACNCWGRQRYFDSLRRRASQVSRVLLYSSNSSGVFVGTALDSSQRYLLLL